MVGLGLNEDNEGNALDQPWRCFDIAMMPSGGTSGDNKFVLGVFHPPKEGPNSNQRVIWVPGLKYWLA